MPKSARVEIRVTDLEKADWAEAAGGVRKVSEWLRALANREATSQRQKIVIPQEEALVTPTGRQKIVPAPPICARAHFHRPGTYCGTCATIQ